mmetsp:Transcript_5562/g.18839  ORF Transcript_5562/g.18839 Transcript_5562/m.18839 type:complete len:288 (-) Transcript_5562:1221-2084(-)
MRPITSHLRLALAATAAGLALGEFQAVRGFIPMTEANAAANPTTMTVDNAMAVCSGNVRCLGFSYKGPPDEARALPVYFKMSTLVAPAPDWTTYRRVYRRGSTPVNAHTQAPAPTPYRPAAPASTPRARAPAAAPSSAPSARPPLHLPDVVDEVDSSRVCGAPSRQVTFECRPGGGPVVYSLRLAGPGPGGRARYMANGTVPKGGEAFARSFCAQLPACGVLTCISMDRPARVSWSLEAAPAAGDAGPSSAAARTSGAPNGVDGVAEREHNQREQGGATFGKTFCLG